MPAPLMLALLLAAGGSATEALRARDVEIRAALPPAGREPTEAERRRVEAAVVQAVDVQAILVAALGERWKAFSAGERRRLSEAFGRRFREASVAELSVYRASQVVYLSEKEAGGAVEVTTRVTADGEPTEIRYALRGRRDGWRIVDLTVDGVSTVENYRASFARVLGREGVEGLIARLERQRPPKGG